MVGVPNLRLATPAAQAATTTAASPLAGAATAAPATATQSAPAGLGQLMQMFQQLQQATGGAAGSAGSDDPTAALAAKGSASTYLGSSGAMQMNPAGDPPKVHKEDDSEYYSALGYDA